MIEMRDRFRAEHAYRCVEGLPKNLWQDYKIAVNSLGAYILRNGLAAAVAWLERYKGLKHDESASAAAQLLRDLRGARILGLSSVAAKPGGASVAEFGEEVRQLGASDYMLATRDVLAALTWFRRAVQALGGQD